MYPQPELTCLAARKRALCTRIARNRAFCAEATQRVTQPLRLLDELISVFRSFAPLAWIAGAPLGLLALHEIGPRIKNLRTLLQWAPTALSLVRHFTGKS
jgi:hypothetical protein